MGPGHVPPYLFIPLAVLHTSESLKAKTTNSIDEPNTRNSVICRLYTVDGDLIHQPHTQLQNKAYYVAVGSEYGGFKQVKYGNPLKPAFVPYGTKR